MTTRNEDDADEADGDDECDMRNPNPRQNEVSELGLECAIRVPGYDVDPGFECAFRIRVLNAGYGLRCGVRATGPGPASDARLPSPVLTAG